MENINRMEEMSFEEIDKEFDEMFAKSENERFIRTYLAGGNTPWRVRPSGAYEFASCCGRNIDVARKFLSATKDSIQLRIDLPIQVMFHERLEELREFVKQINEWMVGWDNKPKLVMDSDVCISLTGELPDSKKMAVKKYFEMSRWITMSGYLAEHICHSALRLMYNPGASLTDVLDSLKKEICSDGKE